VGDLRGHIIAVFSKPPRPTQSHHPSMVGVHQIQIRPDPSEDPVRIWIGSGSGRRHGSGSGQIAKFWIQCTPTAWVGVMSTGSSSSHCYRRNNKTKVVVLLISLSLLSLFTQPPSGRRRMRIYVLQMFFSHFCFLFFVFFSVHQKYETTVLGNG